MLYRMSGTVAVTLELHRNMPVEAMVKDIDKTLDIADLTERVVSKYVPRLHTLELVMPCSALVRNLPSDALVQELVCHCVQCSGVV